VTEAVRARITTHLSPWPEPTQRSREWTAGYALKAYAATWGILIGLGVVARRAGG
jgi:hypothetical protein